MTMTWDKQKFTMFQEADTFWMNFPTGQMAPLGINITKDQAIERFLQLSYTFVYGAVGRILN